MSSRTWRRIAVGAVSGLAAAALVAPASAGAAFPGTDGRIAFVRTSPSGNGIYAIDPDGQNESPLATFPSGFVGAPAYSGDGERIAFSRGGDIHVMDADGQNPAPVTQRGPE